MCCLQPPSLGQACAFEIQKKDVQIISYGYDHWLKVSTNGAKDGTVNVYDSLYLSVGSQVKNQIAAIVNTEEKEIALNFINVQTKKIPANVACFPWHLPHVLRTDACPRSSLIRIE